MGNVNVNPPLVHDRAMSGSLRARARANQCPGVVPFILGGATGPVSMAGAVAQSPAGVMAGVAPGQLGRPGSPAVFGNFLAPANLKAGSRTEAGPRGRPNPPSRLPPRPPPSALAGAAVVPYP